VAKINPACSRTARFYMTRKSNARKNTPPASDEESSENEAAFADLTSSEYDLLCKGEPDEAQDSEYVHLRERQRDIQEQEIRNVTSSDPADYLRVMEESTSKHRKVVWEARRKLVAEMNRATLESLARHYGISPGAECIRDHPDANDLDKGLLLARMREFLRWDGEYLGTAPEMGKIDVEAAKNAAQSRTGKPLPPDNAPVEAVLRYASACKRASDGVLLQALRDCIAVTHICPSLARSLPRTIGDLEQKIEYLEEEVDYLRDIENSKAVNVATVKLEKAMARHRELSESLDQLHSYQTAFAPGNSMPPIVENATDKWMTSQFAAGAPVGSIVRMAWLLDVFHPFWQKHQSGYLVSDPELEEVHQNYSEKGKQGVKTKADAKWQRFTTLFADHVTSATRWTGPPSPDEQAQLVDAFGKHLIDQKTTGASDNRTVGPIKEFLSTLMTNMDRDGGGSNPRTILGILRDNTRRRRKDGRFPTNPFTTLTVETVGACLEILHESIKLGQATRGKTKGSRPRTRG
jgi:hypothetical protein